MQVQALRYVTLLRDRPRIHLAQSVTLGPSHNVHVFMDEFVKGDVDIFYIRFIFS